MSLQILFAVHDDSILDPGDTVLADLVIDGTYIERLRGTNVGVGEVAQHVCPVSVSTTYIQDGEHIFFRRFRRLSEFG